MTTAHAPWRFGTFIENTGATGYVVHLSCEPALRAALAAIPVATQHVNNDYNGFEGMVIDGRPSVVTVRGLVQVRDGQFVGDRRRGRLLRREAMTPA